MLHVGLSGPAGNRKLLAGLAIGSLIFKPQLGLAAAVVFLCTREWKSLPAHYRPLSTQLAAGLEPLRNRSHAHLLACAAAYRRCFASARTEAVSDTFATFVLVTAAAVAASGVCLYVVSAVAILALRFVAGEAKRLWKFAMRHYCCATVLVVSPPHCV